jgi:hypothetical protein
MRVSSTPVFGDVAILPNLGAFRGEIRSFQMTLAPQGIVSPVDIGNYAITIEGPCTQGEERRVCEAWLGAQCMCSN